jgi:hypothetical protein
VSTFTELKEQAEQDIRAHIRPTSSDSAHHFVVDSTNYFVEHGAVLLAALRLWGEPRQKTDGDLRALIDLANAATLENIAEELARSHSPDELHASVQLEGIAYAPPRQLYDTLEEIYAVHAALPSLGIALIVAPGIALFVAMLIFLGVLLLHYAVGWQHIRRSAGA